MVIKTRWWQESCLWCCIQWKAIPDDETRRREVDTLGGELVEHSTYTLPLRFGLRKGVDCKRDPREVRVFILWQGGGGGPGGRVCVSDGVLMYVWVDLHMLALV